MIACFEMRTIGVACERARLPRLAGRPFVLATPDGAVRCASDEARRLGVREGLAGATAGALCRDLVVIPYDLASYTESAEAIWDVIAVETSFVEPVNPELCYAEFDGCDVRGRVEDLASVIARRIEAPVVAGLAGSKLLARAAAAQCAPGVSVIVAGGEAEALSRLPLEFLPAIDAKVWRRLMKLGVTTIGSVRKIPIAEMERQIGRVAAFRLRRLSVGEDGDPVRPVWPGRTIERKHAFDEEVSRETIVRDVLRRCAEEVAAALRLEGKYCRGVALTVQTAEQNYLRESEDLYAPVHDAPALSRVALRLLTRLRLRAPVLSLTLTASQIDSGQSVQLTMLGASGNVGDFAGEREMSLQAEMRTLRRRYGPSSALTGALLTQSNPIRLWNDALTKRRDERISVKTDPLGMPIRIFRGDRGNRRTFGADGDAEIGVRRVLDRWRASEWSWGKIAEVDSFRVLTDAGGAYEIHKTGGEWRLRGVAD